MTRTPASYEQNDSNPAETRILEIMSAIKKGTAARDDADFRAIKAAEAKAQKIHDAEQRRREKAEKAARPIQIASFDA
jgi:hypothetical protein